MEFICRCKCGKEKAVPAMNLVLGNSKSCCGMGGPRRKHGMSHTRIYRVWEGMIQRCTNPNSPAFKDYGGRGIRVCDEWRDFAKFYSDMGDRPSPKHTLERIKNDEGYRQDNCKWATYREQGNNTRATHLITYRGRTRNVSEWSRRTGIPRTVILWRLSKALPLSLVFKKGVIDRYTTRRERHLS